MHLRANRLTVAVVTWFLFGGLAAQASTGNADTAADVSSPFRHLFTDNVRQEPPRVWSNLFTIAPDGMLLAEANRVVIPSPSPLALPPAAAATSAQARDTSGPSITWRRLLGETLLFSLFQHSVRIAFEEHTWERTKMGPFWDDYVTSASNLCCWGDNDKWTTNWLFHPLMGSTAAFIFADNHRDSRLAPPGWTSQYRSAKGKQGLYAAAYSTYFEIGPILSESAIGNVGLGGTGQTWHDIVVTPVMGTAMSVVEDVLRRYVIDPIDRRNHFWGAVAALFGNPTRSVANVMTLQKPWGDPVWLTLQRDARGQSKSTRRSHGVERVKVERLDLRRRASARAAAGP